MAWISQTTQWYVYLLCFGLIFFPISNFLFGKTFQDRGWAFAKTIGIISLTYASFVLGVYKLMPFTQSNLFLLLAIFAITSLTVYLKFPFLNELKKKQTLSFILFEELLFIVGLFVWAYVRGQEPSIRGLEKFMDFGFINSALRAEYFPPQDIWLAGHTINYYYFGHISGAVLTKLSNIPSYVSYNLILATLFALGITQVFSLCAGIVTTISKSPRVAFIAGILGTFILNLAGNLHSIYLFTKGYDTDKPVPFWEIFSRYTPDRYWYPNATRFIPFTIHEFPIYSYVVADLHGHVFDIPFVLLTIAMLFSFFISHNQSAKLKIQNTKHLIFNTILIGFLTAIHYMTNAFDGPIYLLLAVAIFFVLHNLTKQFFISVIILIGSFLTFSFPFSSHFHPFASKIGVNCAPVALTNLGHIGPFLFEKGNCQVSAWWMLLTLWGFFWFNFIFFVISLLQKLKKPSSRLLTSDIFILILFCLSTVLIIIPEFFYIKDIYPAHFRANTMFKLGYQAFMMMSIASTYVFFSYKDVVKKYLKFTYIIGFAIVFTLVAIYPRFAIKSYYGDLSKTPQLDGRGWIDSTYADYRPIIDYLNNNVTGQPTIIEAQGDSYTDYNVVSAYTGLPTVAGWWVHEWLWRGNSGVVGDLIPIVQAIYEDPDDDETKKDIDKFQIKYIVIGSNERKKYTNLKQMKLESLGKVVVKTTEGSLLLKIY